MNSFEPFDPLSSKVPAKENDVTQRAIKREITNILSCYVGWFDPFSELIQNSLDSLDERLANEAGSEYKPRLWITINIKDNTLSVTDNGTGLDEQKFTQFLAPDLSFKSGNTRGHKGVGATFLAYGFNDIQIATRSKSYQATGRMLDGRAWLSNENPAGNPQVKHDGDGPIDPYFSEADNGVSIVIKFDKDSHPREIGWYQARTAEAWHKILSIKTGLGAFHPNNAIISTIKVIDKAGAESVKVTEGISYYWPHQILGKFKRLTDIKGKEGELFNKKGAGFTMPAAFTNLEFFHDTFGSGSPELLALLDAEEFQTLRKYNPSIYFAYGYSADVWPAFNKSVNIRDNVRILSPGIQIASNNMPQGEILVIPLNRNIGRQNQVHFVFHFENCDIDLGRKGYHSDIIDFAKSVAKKLTDGTLSNYRKYLKPRTGASNDLFREKKLEDFRQEMLKHSSDKPLTINSEHFFLPMKRIALTSEPCREQDVIALFNQLLAGGVIRGIKIMATNERFTYDGLYNVSIEQPEVNHLFDQTANPLGISEEVLHRFEVLPFVSNPKVLEYKFSLDALMEDIEDGTKSAKEIGLAVVWTTGENWRQSYKITSLLDPNNLALREYHGLTHVMTDLNSGQREMDLIVLEELVSFLNDPTSTISSQVSKYEAD